MLIDKKTSDPQQKVDDTWKKRRSRLRKNNMSRLDIIESMIGNKK